MSDSANSAIICEEHSLSKVTQSCFYPRAFSPGDVQVQGKGRWVVERGLPKLSFSAMRASGDVFEGPRPHFGFCGCVRGRIPATTGRVIKLIENHHH